MFLAAFFLHPVSSVTFITIGVALASFAYSSFSVNYLDIAPQFAGVLMGICNSFATITGIVSPILTGYIVEDKSEASWRIIFMISGGIYLFGCIIYWIWAQGEIQPWAVQEADTDDNSTKSDDKDDGVANPALDVRE